jgi:MarR family transcriptional regulator, organic hydroperoxide resistance regulator
MSRDSSRSVPRRKSASAAYRRKSERAAARNSSADVPRAALELQTLQAFRTIFASARWHDAEVRRIAGISGSQLWALSEIARSKGMRVNDLSERMALHQTTASNLIYALADRKLIRRERDPVDQRVVRLHVTTDGKRMLLRAPGPYAGLLVDALRHMDSPQLTRLKNALFVLTQDLRDAATDAAGQTLMGE